MVVKLHEERKRSFWQHYTLQTMQLQIKPVTINTGCFQLRLQLNNRAVVLAHHITPHISLFSLISEWQCLLSSFNATQSHTFRHAPWSPSAPPSPETNQKINNNSTSGVCRQRLKMAVIPLGRVCVCVCDNSRMACPTGSDIGISPTQQDDKMSTWHSWRCDNVS